MSKFLRFIVNLCMICLLLGAAALIVPQFAGISTTVVDNDITDTNLSLGSVVYGKKVSLDKLKKGDSLLSSADASVHTLRITKADPKTGEYTLKSGEKKEEKVTLHDNAEKVLVTVPVIGYLAIAIQTFEGRIILGLMIAFLVILFILSEIWKNSEEEEEVEEDVRDLDYEKSDPIDTGHIEEDETAAIEEYEKKTDKVSLDDDTQDTSDVVKEIQELILEPADEPEEKPSEIEDDNFTAAIQAALEKEADAVPKAGSTSQEKEVPEEPDPAMESPAEEDIQHTLADHKILAMPAMTAEELLQKALEEGDDPKIIKYEEEGITLIDYSDVL
ncbi:hypothetical protein INP51_01945 [Blautia liquoris]|uniref:Uncharacterized protein n=1 Tax=Blautia liquoris TaxID=2779518 RepID=A0A7M2RI86_9FIRM|nr:hypothetical protein [Blautia liquoris]QOV19761.1 hypothetical protein INP51_01945 [Blautia liquoris]